MKKMTILLILFFAIGAVSCGETNLPKPEQQQEGQQEQDEVPPPAQEKIEETPPSEPKHETPPSAQKENYGTIDTPVAYTPGKIVVLAVDYTTNCFLGGYTLPVENGDGPFELESDYRSPGDFGSVTFYDKGSRAKLFASDIIWMGTGRMTYPEAMCSPKSFVSTDATDAQLLPELTYYNFYGGPNEGHADELTPVRHVLRKLKIVEQAMKTAPDAPIYASLYMRSVGMGDPADWYWLIFIRG